jgi:hypothetical protein
MRYYKHTHSDGAATHMWLLKIQIEQSKELPLPCGVRRLPGLDQIPLPQSASTKGKTVLWLQEATDIFGIWSQGSGLAFPADKLVYIEMQHYATFRGEPLYESFRIYSLLPREHPEWIPLGLCLPTKPRLTTALNHEAVRNEMLQLNESPLFQGRFEKTIRLIQCNDPY